MIATMIDTNRTLSQVLLLIAAVLFLLEYVTKRYATLAGYGTTHLAWALVAVALMVI